MQPLARATLLASVLASLLIAPRSSAQDHEAAGAPGDFVMRDFRFADGSVLPELRIHYVTLGVPHRDASGTVRNAVLILHGTTGMAGDFSVGNSRASCSVPASSSTRRRTTSFSLTALAQVSRPNRATACVRASRITVTAT
jgi:Homoserine acetyltransferase